MRIKKLLRKVMLCLVIISLLAGTLSSFNKDNFLAAAEGTDVITSITPSFQSIISQFSVTESFIQSQVDKGYTLNQIYSALLRSSIDPIGYEEAISLIAPKEVNNSNSISSSVSNSVYNSVYRAGLSDFNLIKFDPLYPVTREVYGDIATVTNRVYGESKNMKSSITPVKPLPNVAPVYDNNKISEAPFSVTNNGESISTLSGSLSTSLTDMTLPGRNGMSFSLIRRYDTNNAQYYDMGYGTAEYTYPINYYYVVYNAVMKPILHKYDVKYKESYYIENDYSSDGTIDYSSAFLDSYIRTKGSYNNREDAEISKNQSLTFNNPSDTLTKSDTRKNDTNSFPDSVPYNSNGYTGDLPKSGSSFVYSGSYTPEQTKIGSAPSCEHTIAGTYKNGYWTANPGGDSGECPASKYYTGDGYTGDLPKTTVSPPDKECPAYNAGVNGPCTKKWTATYSGTVTKPASADTRKYQQNYQGSVTKPGTQNDTLRYESWISTGSDRYRRVYMVVTPPYIEDIPYEGNGINIQMPGPYNEDIAGAQDDIRDISYHAGSYLGEENGFNFYVSTSPNPYIVTEQVGTGYGSYYYNKTLQPLKEQLYPIGKGWSWNIPFVETKDNKQYLNSVDGGIYEIENNKLKGYDWEGPSVVPDNTVSVNGEASQLRLVSADGNNRQYFTNDGRLIQMSDAHNNKISFYYTFNDTYQRKLLSKIEDAIGNTIEISYSRSQVTLTKENKTVTYSKHLEGNIELLDSVTNEMKGQTTYSYSIKDANFNLFATTPEYGTSNPYALLTRVDYPTGAKTIYDYEVQKVTRYLGADSVNQAYRIQSRKDQIEYDNGRTEDFNVQTFWYNNDDYASSYGQNKTLNTTVTKGKTDTVLTYRKNVTGSGTNLNTHYYLDQSVIKADGTERKKTYSYSKIVGDRNYSATAATEISQSNNRNSDILTMNIQYDDYGNILYSKDANGAVTINTYDSKHLLVTSKESADSKSYRFTEFIRNTFGDITQMTVRKNDASGELLSQQNFSEFDQYGNARKQSIKIDDSKVSDIVFEFDNKYLGAYPTKQTVTVTDIDGVVTNISQTMEYDKSTGLMLSVIDGEKHLTSYEYDKVGRILKYTQEGEIFAVEYNDKLNTITTTDQEDRQSVTHWNGLGMKVAEGIIGKLGYEQKAGYGYDSLGRTVWSEDAWGSESRITVTYDGWGRELDTTTPLGLIQSIRYDDTLRTVTTQDAEGNTNIQTSDMFGHVTGIEDFLTGKPKVKVSSFNYDPISGLATVETDGNNNTKVMAYDAWGLLNSVTNTVDGREESTHYSYDLIGNITKILFADNTEKVKTYDQLGRLIQERNEKNEVTKYYYDGNNNLIKTVDRSKNSMSYEYNKHNLLYRKVSSDETVTFAYDGTGKRTGMSDNTGTTGYGYDPYSGLLTTVTTPDKLQLIIKYDANGNREELTDPFGGKQFYSFDKMNRLKTIGESKNQPEVSYTYYNNGNLHTTSAPNGALTTMSYEGARINSIEQTIKNISINSYKYIYDNNGNLISQDKNSKIDIMNYDSLNRISTSSEFSTSYSYDNRGNRTSMISGRPLPEVKTTTYVYDKENRLTQAKIGSTSNYSQTDYRYNGDGLLVERTALNETTRYYYDGDQIIAEAKIVNGKPELKARYIRGNRLEAIQYADGKKAYVLYNGHGDIEELRDEQGNSLNKYDYDMWGNIIAEKEQVYNPFRYSGELWDDITKLQYLRARWYDPSVGRFINEDTVEGQINNPLSLNLYTYVNNNPLTRWDPSGQSWISDQWNGFLKDMKTVHSSWESALGYWTLGITNSFFEAYRAEPFSKEYWIAQAEIFSNFAAIGFGGAAEKQLAEKALNSIFSKVVTKSAYTAATIGGGSAVYVSLKASANKVGKITELNKLAQKALEKPNSTYITGIIRSDGTIEAHLNVMGSTSHKALGLTKEDIGFNMGYENGGWFINGSGEAATNKWKIISKEQIEMLRFLFGVD